MRKNLFGLLFYFISASALAQQPPTLPYAVTGATSTGLLITKPVGSGTTSATPMPVILSSGGSTIGTVDIDQTTPGTTNGVVVNSSALPSGAATSAIQNNVRSAPGTPQTTALTVQGNASGVPIPVSGSISVTPATSTSAGPDISTVTTGGTAVNAFSAGHCSKGCLLVNPINATTNLCANAATTASGTQTNAATLCAAPGQQVSFPAVTTAISAISSDSSHTFGGMGFQ